MIKFIYFFFSEMESENDENIGNNDVITPKRQKLEREKSFRYLLEFDGKQCNHCIFKSASAHKMRASNAQRHLERAHKHVADFIAAEIKGKKDSSFGVRRSLTLFASTTTFPLQQIENDLLQVFRFCCA